MEDDDPCQPGSHNMLQYFPVQHREVVFSPVFAGFPADSQKGRKLKKSTISHPLKVFRRVPGFTFFSTFYFMGTDINIFQIIHNTVHIALQSREGRCRLINVLRHYVQRFRHYEHALKLFILLRRAQLVEVERLHSYRMRLNALTMFQQDLPWLVETAYSYLAPDQQHAVMVALISLEVASSGHFQDVNQQARKQNEFHRVLNTIFHS